MKVAIIGTGYVGLSTGACFAHMGHSVICQDIDDTKIKLLKTGKSTIYEPGLEEIIKKEIKRGNLIFTNDLLYAIQNSDIIFICVNTPPKQDGHADLKYVEKVARDIAKCLNSYKIIVDKSTVPIKTAEKVKDTIKKYSNNTIEFDVVSNPEFLREGHAVEDILHPDRIVIGVESSRAKDIMLKLYEPFLAGNKIPVKITSVKSAELIKHGANTFLAAKISYANLIAEVCEAAGADAKEVLEAIGLDERIGRQFLHHGIGFGGSCFPKDIKAFKKTLEIFGIDNSFIQAIEKINDLAQERFIKKIEKELWVLDGKIIAILGLSFKPNTDDIRNAPSLKIIEHLKNEGAKIQAHDPKANDKMKVVFPDIEYFQDSYECIAGSDACVLCTEWDEYKNLDYKKIKDLMQTPMVFDGRNIIDKKQGTIAGLRIIGVG